MFDTLYYTCREIEKKMADIECAVVVNVAEGTRCSSIYNVLGDFPSNLVDHSNSFDGQIHPPRNVGQ